jgi:hypothetical protein
MPRSYERINYSLRPCKSVERKMLCEGFRRLSPFASLKSYRYVGFGSPYFTDFRLIHRALGAKQLVSIERDVDNSDRFSFNKPFDCIEMKFGESNDVLDDFEWSVRTIMWLDYDGGLDRGVLTDIRHFCANAISGSILVVTTNAHPKPSEGKPPEEIREYRLQQLKDEVGEENVPQGTSGSELAGWGTAAVYRKIITNHISYTLMERNGLLADQNQFLYEQLFNFRYADGAKMVTVGGAVYDRGQAHVLASCAFAELDFVRGGDEPFLIDLPNLTYREIRRMDSQLPCQNPEQILIPPIPEADKIRYAKFYRYFPTFTEAEL